jgi:hypothetical protein
MEKNFIYDLMLPYFVGSDENRPQFSKVHKGKNGYLYASDGSIAIRIPADRTNMEYDEVPNFPNAERTIQSLIDRPDYIKGIIKTDDIVRILAHVNWRINKDIEKCDGCNGTGVAECLCCGSEYDCNKCNGTGRITSKYIEELSLLKSEETGYSIKIREAVYKEDYLYIIALMAKLLHVEEITYLYGHRHAVAMFSFDGVDIALAPTLFDAGLELII